MNMIEIIGKALADACQAEFGSTWDNEVRWQFARVAIRAMKLETAAMEAAGAKAIRDFEAAFPNHEDSDYRARICWEAMLTAALSEEPACQAAPIRKRASVYPPVKATPGFS